MSRYCIPLIIAITYVLLGQFYYFYFILPILLLANLLNVYWGEFEMSELKKELQKFYGTKAVRLIKRVSAVCFMLMIVWSINIVDSRYFSIPYFLLFVFCTGCLTGCFIVTLAHDLLHSKYGIDKFLSSGLLIAASIPHLTGDHIFGHHRNIGLLKDPTTARVNQNFYTYFFKLSITQIRRSLFLKHENIPNFMRKKILFYSLLRIGAWLVTCVIIFMLTANPVKCLLFFLLQGFISYVFYELTNYIQHYGLTRYTDNSVIKQSHSWNCYYKYTNYILFMLPVHSLHHLPTANRHVKEETLLDGPKMPYLYFVMIAMALVPPIWFKKMNGLALKYNKVNQ